MRHHDKNRKFGRIKKQRDAMLASLARALVANERIETTEARAKELRPYVEKLVTKGRNPSVSSRRLIAERLGGSGAEAQKVVNDISARYQERHGGYTRVIKLPPRESDGSPMAIIEFV